MQLALREATRGWRRVNGRGSIIDEEGNSVAFNGRGGSDKDWINQGEANVNHILNCSRENVEILLDVIREYEEALKGTAAVYPAGRHALKSGKKWLEKLQVSCPPKS